MKYSLFFFILFLTCEVAQSQKREREVRLKKTEFPEVMIHKIGPYLENARRTRFYREYDGEKVSYEVKFKKDRLFYSVEFNADGILEDVEFIITEDDIPQESFTNMESYINDNFNRHRIKKIQQQHPNQKNGTTTLREAFQNLLLPYINYEIIIASKGEKGFEEYELLFDAHGKFLSSRKSSPQKYDHVLY